MGRLILKLLSLSGLLMLSWCNPHQLKVIHSWKTVDFVYPSHERGESMIASGHIIPKNNILLDVDVWENEHGEKKTFVSLPKFNQGVPVTLATVEHDGSLKPYPDWSWHQEHTCDLHSVFRMQVDKCNRLWVLDSGVEQILSGNPQYVCRPQLLLFDLYTDKLLMRYQFPDDVVNPKSTLVTIAVDTRGDHCEDTFAYIADVVSSRLIVFDAQQHRSWNIASNYFYPYPFQGRFNICGVKFDLMDGILGLALGPLIHDERTLYWHSLASVRESWVDTSVIRNESLFLKASNRSPHSFKVSSGVRESQSAAQAMSSNGILFFGLLGSNSIACWNSKLPYTSENIHILDKNDEDLQFPSGIKIINGKLYVMTDRFQNQMIGEVSDHEVTYRILVGDLDEMTAGTPCETHEKIYIHKDEPKYSHGHLSEMPLDHHSIHKSVYGPTTRLNTDPMDSKTRIQEKPTKPVFANHLSFTD